MTTYEKFSTPVSGILSSLKTENLPEPMEGAEFDDKVNAIDTAALNLCALSNSSPGSPASDFSEDQENSATNGSSRKPATMDRRNARERNRVRFLNMTFDVLRQHLPQKLNGSAGSGNKAKSKKMSKVDTLRAAIDYIHHLQEMLEESDAVDAALKDCDPEKPFDTQLLSPNGSLGSSGSPHTVSDEGIGSEEDDLLDVTNWFQC